MTAPIHDAEEAFIAGLLGMDHQQADTLVSLLQRDDLTRPALQLIHQLIGELAAAGVNPDPAAILAHAIAEEHVTGAHHIQTFTGVLMRLIDHRALTYSGSVRWYAVHVLDQAVRRRTVEMTVRLAQVADHADTDELERLTQAEHSAIEAVRARHRSLAQPPRGLVAAA